MNSDFGGLEGRRRRQFRGRVFRFLSYGTVLTLVCYWAYLLGAERAANANRDLIERQQIIADENDRLRGEADAAIAARAAADDRAASVQRLYEAEVPQGPAREIMALVNQRLEEGIRADRVAFVVGMVRNETRCDGELESRRFMLPTPISRAQNGYVAFSDGLITVTGKGDSARNANGDVEAWFDTAQAVTLTFTLIGGDAEEVGGLLPIHHAVVVDDTAHQFTVEPAESRGFVRVSRQVCDYP